MTEAILAVDIGSTKFDVAVVTTEGQILFREKASSKDARNGDELFGRLARLMAQMIDLAGANRVELLACGVGTAGPMRPRGEYVSPNNTPAWRDFPLRSRIAEAALLPSFVDNDCKALALGEGWLGAAKGIRNYMSSVVSTGVGGGIVLDGRLLDGGQGNAGHWGHIIVEPNGPLCNCGTRGCLEAMIAGPHITKRFGIDPKDATPEIIDEVGRYFAQALVCVAHTLDLEMVTVAGSVALGFGDQFFDSVRAHYDEMVGFPFARGMKIVPAGLGADTPIIGAAAVGLVGIDRDVLG